MRINIFKILSIVLGTFLIFAPTLYAKMSTPVRTLEERFSGGDEEVDLKEIEQDILQRVYAQPYNSKHYELLAAFYDHTGDYQSELEALQNQVAYLPDDAEDKDMIYGNLARAFILNGKWEKGKEWLDKADAININNYYNRTYAFRYYTQHKFDVVEAAKQLAILDQISEPDQDRFYDGLTEVLEIKEIDLKQIGELFEEVVRQNPNHPKAIRTLGAALRYQALLEKNIPMDRVYKLLHRAIELDPKFIPSYITLANTYMIEDKMDNSSDGKKDAIGWVQRARQVDSTNLKLDYVEGNIYLLYGDYSSAIELFNKSIKKKFEIEGSKQQLAYAYNGQAYEIYTSGKNLNEGLVLIEQAIELSPDDGIILSTKAELLYKLGRYEEAYEYIKRSVELEPSRPDIIADVKMIEEALGISESFLSKIVISSEEIEPNEKVRIAEELLSKIGYDPGKVDGIIDISTRDAIEKYQRDNDLKPTRLIDTNTWEQLNQVTNK